MPGTTGHYYGDVPNRLIALLIDAVILSFLIFIAALILSALFGPVVRFNLQADTLKQEVRVAHGLEIVDSILALAIGAAYFMLSWTWLGGSLGKRALGMRIGGEGHSARLLTKQAFVRWTLLIAPFGVAAVLITVFRSLDDAIVGLLVLVWYVFLLVTVARSATKQGFHDRVAHTIVVKEASAVAWAPEGDPVR